MKNCPNCGHQNPKNRQLCLGCGKLMKNESVLLRIASGFMWVAGGVVLIAADFKYDLRLFKLIPIPFALTILGIFVIFYGVGKIFFKNNPFSPMNGGIRSAKKEEKSPII